jgi:hypothetical protein
MKTCQPLRQKFAAAFVAVAVDVAVEMAASVREMVAVR